MQELFVKSSIDGSSQPVLFHACSEANRPLLVGLHTWSFDRFNQVDNMLPYAREHNWNLLLPEFRGPNLPGNPHCQDACGSKLAKQDVFDAIAYVVEHYEIDTDQIYLLGLSGGGHMALLAAAMHPEVFKAVAAFVPISGLKSWHDDDGMYVEALEACLGGPPDEAHIKEYRKRSPMHFISRLAKVNLKIFHGKYDPVVSVTQSVKLYEKISKKFPQSRVFLDVFDGGHEMSMDAAFTWFLSQMHKQELTQVSG